MGRPNFDDSLRLPIPTKRQPGGEELGPEAHGPVPEGDKLNWIYVWIIQNGPSGRAAAAYGESPEHGLPFSGTWETETEMTHDSDEFTPGRPAQASAMALVVHADGTKEVDWWSEPVMLDPPAGPGTPTA